MSYFVVTLYNSSGSIPCNLPDPCPVSLINKYGASLQDNQGRYLQQCNCNLPCIHLPGILPVYHYHLERDGAAALVTNISKVNSSSSYLTVPTYKQPPQRRRLTGVQELSRGILAMVGIYKTD